jgi:hypothetical protein
MGSLFSPPSIPARLDTGPQGVLGKPPSAAKSLTGQ